jgi:two-component system sensor histidine kinase MtrB
MAVIFGVLVYERTAADRAAHARALESQRARIAASLFASTGRLAFGASVNDPSAPAALRRAVSDGQVASFLRTTHPAMVWAGAPVKGGVGGIFVNTSFAGEEQALAALRALLLEIGLLLTVVIAAGGSLFAWRLSARLRGAARVAGRIGEQDPGARIGMRGRDEVAALARAVDRTADSLQQRIERERRFAADVAHELRTPVAGLLAASGLLDDGEAAGMVRDRARRLARLVEDLLEISRLEAGVESSQRRAVDLAVLARSVCAEHPVRIAGPGGQAVSDPRRLARIISNLVENACRHGRPPVVVEIADCSVRVSDSGPGFSEEMLAHGTERFASASSARSAGTGLGLAIAAAQARVIGAKLCLANDVDGGAVVTVSLPDLHKTAMSEP